MSTEAKTTPRVVSLLPSGSEIVARLGGQHLLVGVSHECDYPADAVKGLPRLTSAANGHFTTSRQVHEETCAAVEAGRGLYAVDGEQLVALRPTHIITQGLCGVCAVDTDLVQDIIKKHGVNAQLVSLNPFTLHEVLSEMETLGQALGLGSGAQEVVAGLRRRAEEAQAKAQSFGPAKHQKVAFLEWTDPLFMGGHWTPQLIHMAGGSHPLNPPSGPGGAAGPSTAQPAERLLDLDPDLIIICPCGLDLDTGEQEANALAKEPWWPTLRAVREGRVFLVDGNAHFNRPGPRLVDALEWLVAILHDRWELMPADFPWRLLSPPAPSSPANTQQPAGEDGGSAGAGKSHQQQQEDQVEGEDGAAFQPAWCAPGMPPDIEEAHAACCKAHAAGEGRGTYADPRTGYSVFSEAWLRARGTCCGNRCRHCPYGHQNVRPHQGTPRINHITRPTWLALPKSAAGRSGTAGSSGAATVLVAVARGQEDGLAARVAGLLGQGATAVAVVAVDPHSRAVWVDTGAHASAAAEGGPAKGGVGLGSKDPLGSVLDACMAAGLPVVALPVYPQQAARMLLGSGAAGPSAGPAAGGAGGLAPEWAAMQAGLLQAAQAALPANLKTGGPVAWSQEEAHSTSPFLFPWLGSA